MWNDFLTQINKKLMRAAGMVNRVKQEVGIHSGLRHPSVLKLYAYFEDDDFVYLVLELCENGELQRYLKALGHPLSEDEVREVMTQLLDGMLYLHSHNILHRDLSLANLLITRDMKIVIWNLKTFIFQFLIFFFISLKANCRFRASDPVDKAWWEAHDNVWNSKLHFTWSKSFKLIFLKHIFNIFFVGCNTKFSWTRSRCMGIRLPTLHTLSWTATFRYRCRKIHFNSSRNGWL